jgi:hypothetical protein
MKHATGNNTAQQFTWPAEVYLTEFDSSEYFCVKASPFLPEFGGAACCGNHAAFFDHHWNSIWFPVDYEVGSDAVGEYIIRDGIFCETINNTLNSVIFMLP